MDGADRGYSYIVPRTNKLEEHSEALRIAAWLITASVLPP